MLPHLVEMIEIDVRVTGRVDEFPGSQTAHLRYHHCQQSVRGDVERHPKESVRASLIELAGKLTLSDIELEKAVARRQSHLVHFSGVPSGNENPS